MDIVWQLMRVDVIVDIQERIVPLPIVSVHGQTSPPCAPVMENVWLSTLVNASRDTLEVIVPVSCQQVVPSMYHLQEVSC